jgi:hypothetical protein
VKAAPPNGEPVSDSVSAPIVTVPLKGLSAPRQLVPLTGVIVYCHDPGGTNVSSQLSPATVPAQVLNGLTVPAPPPSG